MTSSQPGPNSPGALPGSSATQLAQDAQHLDLIYIFHYVLAAMAGVVACFPIFHVLMGLGMAFGMGTPVGAEEDVLFRGFGLLFSGFATAIILTGWAFAILVAINGHFQSKRIHYRFCLVISAVECFFAPFGTILGILTLIVLARPTVKAVFDVGTAPPAGGAPAAPSVPDDEPPATHEPAFVGQPLYSPKPISTPPETPGSSDAVAPSEGTGADPVP
jgi:hypothetical protein